MICIGYNQRAVLANTTYNEKYIRVFTRWQTTWVFITLTDDDVENILNH